MSTLKATCFFLLSLLAFSMAQAQEASNTIVEIDPPATTVSVQGADGTPSERGADSVILPGDHLLTRPDQSVVVELQDGSQITVAPSSEFVILDDGGAEQGRPPHVSLTSGTAHFSVSKNPAPNPSNHSTFFIHTPTAVLGVRGTEFVVEQSANESVVHTFEGQVAMGKTADDLLKTDSSVLVGANETSSYHPGTAKPTAPVRFDRTTYLNQLAQRHPRFARQLGKAHLRRQSRQLKRTQYLKNRSDKREFRAEQRTERRNERRTARRRR